MHAETRGARPLAGSVLTGSAALLLALATVAVYALPEPTSAVVERTAGGRGAAALASTSPADRGRQLFQTKGCIGCHSAPGLRSPIGAGPELSRVALEFAAARRQPGLAAEPYARESIRDPAAYIAPGWRGGFVSMPAIPLTDEELDALVAFLLAEPP